MYRVFSAAVLLGAIALTVTAQSPSVVRGRVLAADGTALHNVRVAVTAAQSSSPVFTDVDGVFSVTVQAGATLSVTRSGYVPATVAIGNAAEIRLIKAAAISGRILDPAGDPLTGMTVEAHRINGGSPAPEATTAATAVVDDLGDYRVSGLSEGRYEISVIALSPILMPEGALIDPRNGPLRRTIVVNGRDITTEQSPFSTRTYYPGVTAVPEAQPIAVAAGEDRQALDFTAARQSIVPFPLNGAVGVAGAAVQATYRGSIEGTIIGSDGRGVPQAVVQLESDDYPSFPPVVVSDADGHFVFNRLPSIDYRVHAAKAGFLTGWWAKQQPADFGDVIELGANQAVKNADIRLARAGAIEGRVIDERGDPVENAAIQVLEWRYVDGRRQLVDAGGSGARKTDDRGHYRLYGLDPGQYLVRVRVGHVDVQADVSDLAGYAPTYVPASIAAADAQVISLEAGRDYTGADAVLVKASTVSITGRIVSPSGNTGGSLTLAPSVRSGAASGERVGGRRLPDGSFEFPNVPPGEYVIQSFFEYVLRSPATGNQTLTNDEFGVRFVTVNGTDVSGVIVPRSLGSTATGRFVEDASDGTGAHAADVTAVPTDPDRSPRGTGAHTRFTSQFAFEIRGLNGPHVFRIDRPRAGWMLKAVRVNGRDVTDTPIEFGTDQQSIEGLEIVMTRNVTEVSGTVTDARGRFVPHASVVVFSSDRSLWGPFSRFLAEARTDKSGAFEVSRLPPGDYFAAATVGGKEGDLQDPVRLEGLTTGAARVTIDEGQSLQVLLRVSR